jgi:membrane associated rhomboid family serine protease
VSSDRNKFWQNVIITFLLVAVLWVVEMLQYAAGFDFSAYANHPRHIEGLKGIIFSPFLHNPNSLDHIISNTLPLMVLLMVLLSAYPLVALQVLVFVHIGSGALVWLFAPEHTYHVGVSGIVYGLAFFLIASGLFRKDQNSVTIAIFIALVYGGMVIGFLPTKGVSWQSHLYGAVCGIIIAFLYRRRDLPPPHPFELEDRAPDKHFFEELEQI